MLKKKNKKVKFDIPAIKANFDPELNKNNRVINTTSGAVRTEYIDYTFRNRHSKIIGTPTSKQTKFTKDKEIASYIYDLENTFLLNKDYIKNLIPLMMENKNKRNEITLLTNLTKIEKLFLKKKSLRKARSEYNGKILINKQITEESKRRTDENNLYYKDQVLEAEDNILKKISLIKQFQKKFNEVEIFVQRESRYPKNIAKFGHLKDFKVVPYLTENELLIRSKEFYQSLIKQRAGKANELINENNYLKTKDTIYIKINRDKNKNLYDIANENLNSLIKFKEMIKEKLRINREIICRDCYNNDDVGLNFKKNDVKNTEEINKLQNNIEQYTNRERFKDDVEGKLAEPVVNLINRKNSLDMSRELAKEFGGNEFVGDHDVSLVRGNKWNISIIERNDF